MTTYRTDDFTRWGYGKGSNLTADEVDLNFWDFDVRMSALEDHHATNNRSIDHISVDASNNMFVVYTDSTVDGPFPLPVAAWNDTGNWLPSTVYVGMRDIVNAFGGVYLVLQDHTSDTTFSAGATDGSGHPLYQLIIRIKSIPSYNIADSTYTPDLTVADSYLRFTDSHTGCVITIANSTAVAWQPYTELHFHDATEIHGGGGIMILAGSGVTLNIPEPFTNLSAFNHATIFAKNVGVDEWDLGGQLALLSSP